MNQSTYWPDFNDLWDYADPASTEEKFNQLLATTTITDATSHYILQLQTQRARTYSLRSDFQQAHQILDKVAAEIASCGEIASCDETVSRNIVEVRYLLERGRCFNSAGQPKQAVPLFAQAAHIAEEIGAEYYWVDALHMLGISAPASEQLAWHQKGVAVARCCTDERARNWEGSLLNNIGWGYFEQEDYQHALETFEATATFYKNKPDQLDRYQIAQWSIAKTKRMQNHPAEGLFILRDLESAGKMDGFTEEEIGECLLALGQVDAAKPYFQEAYHKLSQISWVAADTKRIERLNQYRK